MKKLILILSVLLFSFLAQADELSWYNYTFGDCRLNFQKTSFDPAPETGTVDMLCGSNVSVYAYSHVSPVIVVYVPMSYYFVRAIDGSLYSLSSGYWIWSSQYKPD